jgi:hypothetical protein
MAKRGEQRPYRMTYRWPSGPSGTESFATRERAEDAARAQRERISGLTGEANCLAWVHHRDDSRRQCTECPKRAEPGRYECFEHDDGLPYGQPIDSNPLTPGGVR